MNALFAFPLSLSRSFSPSAPAANFIHFASGIINARERERKKEAFSAAERL